jgi:hypothetical protein
MRILEVIFENHYSSANYGLKYIINCTIINLKCPIVSIRILKRVSLFLLSVVMTPCSSFVSRRFEDTAASIFMMEVTGGRLSLRWS